MPAKDRYHETVVQALIKDGWEITNDPLFLAYGSRELYVNLGAEKQTITAEKGNLKISDGCMVRSFILTLSKRKFGFSTTGQIVRLQMNYVQQMSRKKILF